MKLEIGDIVRAISLPGDHLIVTKIPSLGLVVALSPADGVPLPQKCKVLPFASSDIIEYWFDCTRFEVIKQL